MAALDDVAGADGDATFFSSAIVRKVCYVMVSIRTTRNFDRDAEVEQERSAVVDVWRLSLMTKV